MEQNFAYLAGLIDGDGCISLHRKKDKKARRGITYVPYMTIASKDLWFLEKVQEIFGGSIWKQGKSAFENKTIVYQLWFSSNIIRKLLPDILPYLILKKQQGILLLKAVTITKNHRNKSYDESIVLDKIADDMKVLKINTITILN